MTTFRDVQNKLNALPAISGTDLLEWFIFYLEIDRRSLEYMSSTLEDCMKANIILQARKFGLVEEIEVQATNPVVGQIILRLPYYHETTGV